MQILPPLLMSHDIEASTDEDNQIATIINALRGLGLIRVFGGKQGSLLSGRMQEPRARVCC